MSLDKGLAIAHISAVASGLTCTTGTAGHMLRALADAQINIGMIATSEIRTSRLASVAEDIKALQVIQEGFEVEGRLRTGEGQ